MFDLSETSGLRLHNWHNRNARRFTAGLVIEMSQRGGYSEGIPAPGTGGALHRRTLSWQSKLTQ